LKRSLQKHGLPIAKSGGAMRDFEVIGACNEHGAALVFTDQRVFRH